MSISAFRLFCDVVRSKSFSRGAAINGISQSAASQSISHLERMFGAQLIDRRKRPFVLTSEGDICYRGLTEILHQHEAIKAGIENCRNHVTGTVHVAAIYSVGLHDMKQAMQQFMGLHPHANIRLEYQLPGNIYKAVRNGEFDLGIVSYATPSNDLSVIPMREEKMVLVSHPDHHLASKEAIDPAQLHGEDFIAFDQDLPIARELDRYFRQNQVSVRKVMEFNNVENIKQAVEIGAGLSVLPEPTVRREVAVGELVAITLRHCGLRRPIGIVHQQRKIFTPAMVQFIDILRNNNGTS